MYLTTLIYTAGVVHTGVPLPTDRVYDGKDMSDVLLLDEGKSKHEVLFM